MIGWLLGVCSFAHSQELVPNGDFNYSDTCQPGSLMNGFMTEPWVQWSSSPDFYHPCKQEDYSVPDSFGGGSNPLEGNGYIGMVVYVTTFTGREFVTVELLNALTEDVSYHVEFNVSMMDSAWYATKNIGTLFTVNLPPLNQAVLLGLEPQVKYQGTDFLSNKNGWLKIEGSFIAEGGENQLTIGNFDTDEETDTLFVTGGGMPPSHSEVYWSQAHYYIDGVSVIPDSIYLGVDDIENEEVFNLYPNPNSGTFTVMAGVDASRIAEMTIWGIRGQQVYKQFLQSGTNNINIEAPNGLYFYEVTVNGIPKWTGKVSISSD
jgi:hypothetical protein